eukprot:1806493-Rhodomonas_salina.5
MPMKIVHEQVKNGSAVTCSDGSLKHRASAPSPSSAVSSTASTTTCPQLRPRSTPDTARRGKVGLGKGFKNGEAVEGAEVADVELELEAHTTLSDLQPTLSEITTKLNTTPPLCRILRRREDQVGAAEVTCETDSHSAIEGTWLAVEGTWLAVEGTHTWETEALERERRQPSWRMPIASWTKEEGVSIVKATPSALVMPSLEPARYQLGSVLAQGMLPGSAQKKGRC